MYTLTSKQAAEAAALIINQSPYADIDYLVRAALRSVFGCQVIIDLDSEEYSEGVEDAFNAYGAIEYHIKELKG